ncbi:MAG: lysophospholipid acyltransferase family protein [Nanoarchaeota archaeon]
MVYPIVRFTLIPLLNLFIKEVKGVENIPKKGAFIMAANHESYLDPLMINTIMISRVNRRIHFLASTKTKLFWNMFGGEYFLRHWAGVIPLRKEDKGKSALKEATELLKKGEIAGIFPRPRQYPGENIKPKTGVARLILSSRKPLLPVAVKGTFKLMPNRPSIPKFKRNVTVIIGKPITFDKYYKEKVTKNLLRKMTTEIINKIDHLHKNG